MKTFSFLSLVAVSLLVGVGVSTAAERHAADTVATETTSSSLIVAELFTSQGCSSCPPAERLFSTLAEQENVLTLEWHVDIWDSLVHGGSRWKDPYSDEAFTERQRSYNRSIRGQNGIYTPQAIVNGQTEGVGSRSGEVSHMLENADALPVTVNIANNEINVGSTSQTADILFLRLLKTHETDIKGGENKGLKLAGQNIVLDASVLGQTGSKAAKFYLPSVRDGETCAVLIQTLDGSVGPILGAAKCA